MAKTPTNTNTNGTPASAATAEVEKVKKNSKAFVVYVKADESVVNFPANDAVVVRTEFSNGVKRDIDITKLSDGVKHCAMLQGLATRTQRSYQAEKEIDKVIESFDETVADLLNGVWIDSKSGEAKVTMLSKAIVLSLEQSGATVDEERRKGIIEKLKNADYRDKANANEHVQAHLATLRLEAAKQRAVDAKKAAKENASSATEGLSDF